jgi:putative PEP-CTERM system TPR-repeat lipoprotein
MRRAIVASVCALALACSESPSPDKMIASAKEFLAKGDRPAAIIQLKNALQVAPDNGDARFLLGKASVDSRDFSTAESQLRRALELGQSADAVLPLLARAMIELGQQKALLKEFGDRPLTEPQAVASFQTTLGNAYLEGNDVAAAAKAYAAALEAKPDYAPAQLGRAFLAVREGRNDEALAQVESIIASSPKFAEAYGLKADLLRVKGDRAGAKQALEQAIERDPAFLVARLSLLNLLIEDRDLEAAGRLLGSTQSIAPKDLRVAYFEALLAFHKGEIEKARQQVQQVLKLMPDHLPSLVLEGTIELRDKRYVAAETSLRKALSIAPGHLGARQLLTLTYLRMGQPVKARDTLEPLVDRGLPPDPRWQLLAGETYLVNGDVKRATAFFEAATKGEKADQVIARTRLGQIALVAGRSEEGYAELEAASELDAESYQADLALIAGHLRRKEIDRAMSAVKALEKKQPRNPLTFQMYGVVNLAKRDLDAARKSFERALELQPTYLPSAYNLAQLDILQKKPEEARKRYEAMIAAEPNNERLYIALAELQARTGATPAEIVASLERAVKANPQAPAARIALIDAQRRAGDSKAAFASAQEAIAAIPANPRLLEAAGAAQEAVGEINQAIGTYNKWAAVQPESAKPLLRLAGLYLGQKNYDMAIDDLKRAKKLASDARDTSTLLVQAYMAANRPEDALMEARELQKRDPKSAVGYALEGDAYARQKKYPQAEKAYREALKIAPGNEGVAINLHRVLVVSGKAADAETFVNKWISDNPKSTAIRLYLADREASAGNAKGAAAHYRTVIEREPNNVLALNNLAWIGGEMGDPKALSYAERAASLAPDQASVLDTYGTLLIKQGQAAKGLDYLARASTLDSVKYGVRRLKYARALAEAGQKDLARKELEALQAVPEDFPGKSDIPALLKAL